VVATPSLTEAPAERPASRPCCGEGCGVKGRTTYVGSTVEGVNCDRPLRAVRGCGAVEIWRCNGHRASICVPCSERYRRRLARIAETGSNRRSGYLYMLTLTAPGDAEHYLPNGDACACTPVGGVDLAEWNASAAARWNHLRTLLKRENPGLQFLRAVEVQKRGALHLHVIVWVPGDVLLTPELRRMALRCGFGHSVDLAPVTPGSRKHAYYVSKYVTKACDSRHDVPWAIDDVDPATGEILRREVPGRYRVWSASREWGLTMADMRQLARVAAAEHRARLQLLEVEAPPYVHPLVASLRHDLYEPPF
jgi:hypothetical protein